MIKYIMAFDFETSALPQDGGKAVEFAAMLLDRNTYLPIQGENTFHCYLNPTMGAHWDPKAFQINGITPEKVKQVGLEEGKFIVSFYQWLYRNGVLSPLCGHDKWDKLNKYNRMQVQLLAQNTMFDWDILRDLIPPDMLEVFHFRKLDTMQYADLINRATKWGRGSGTEPFRDPEEGGPSVSLEAQANEMGLDTHGMHGALKDCQILAEVFRRHIITLSGDLVNSMDYLAQQERGRV